MLWCAAVLGLVGMSVHCFCWICLFTWESMITAPKCRSTFLGRAASVHTDTEAQSINPSCKQEHKPIKLSCAEYACLPEKSTMSASKCRSIFFKRKKIKSIHALICFMHLLNRKSLNSETKWLSTSWKAINHKNTRFHVLDALAYLKVYNFSIKVPLKLHGELTQLIHSQAWCMNSSCKQEVSIWSGLQSMTRCWELQILDQLNLSPAVVHHLDEADNSDRRRRRGKRRGRRRGGRWRGRTTAAHLHWLSTSWHAAESSRLLISSNLSPALFIQSFFTCWPARGYQEPGQVCAEEPTVTSQQC